MWVAARGPRASDSRILRLVDGWLVPRGAVPMVSHLRATRNSRGRRQQRSLPGQRCFVVGCGREASHRIAGTQVNGDRRDERADKQCRDRGEKWPFDYEREQSAPDECFDDGEAEYAERVCGLPPSKLCGPRSSQPVATRRVARRMELMSVTSSLPAKTLCHVAGRRTRKPYVSSSCSTANVVAAAPTV